MKNTRWRKKLATGAQAAVLYRAEMTMAERQIASACCSDARKTDKKIFLRLCVLAFVYNLEQKDSPYLG